MKTLEKQLCRQDNRSVLSHKKSPKRSINSSEIYNEETIQKSYISILSKLNLLLKDLTQGTGTVSFSGKIIRLRPIDTVRALSNLKTENDTELVIRNIILNSALSVDKKKLGSAFVFLKMFLESQEEDGNWFFRTEAANCLKVLKSYNGNTITSNIVKNILEISGPNSKIFFRLSSDNNFHLSNFRGKTISAKKHELFTCEIKSMENAKILFIDGIVESIGEIEGMLQEFFKSKEKALIVSAGWSPDIANTLNENFKSGSLKVIPAVYGKIDSEQLNEYCLKNDFEIVTPRINSSLRNCRSENMGTVSKILFNDNSITISGDDEGSYSTEIKIPSRLENIFGILKDKILFSYYIVSDCCRNGVAVIGKNKDLYCPASCLSDCSKAVKDTKKLILDLHRVIKV